MTRRLEWELRYRRDEFSIEAGRAKGRPDPEWLIDCPELLPGDAMYHEAFWALRTEAVSGGMSLGWIPWSKVRQYAVEELGLGSEMLGPFWTVVHSMDACFLGWQKNEYDRHMRRSRPSPKAKGGEGRVKYDR